MTFRCANVGGNTWTSLLRPTNPPSADRGDGEIEVETEDNTTGDFIGLHFDTGTLISGRCTRGGGTGDTCTDAAPCRIQFRRRFKDGNPAVFFTVIYDGQFFKTTKPDGSEVFKTIDGLSTYRIRQRGRENVARGAALLQAEEDGTWVGEKPVT